MSTIAVIDFETTGMSPSQGARATEVGIVLLQDGEIVGRFASLMNAGAYVSPFIERLTGISNAMIASAPPAEEVMAQAWRFVGQAPMVAHNAAFDRRFWQAELARIGLEAAHPFACTVLLSRRLYSDIATYRLGALAARFELPNTGRAHRALADAETTAYLLRRIQRDLCRRHDAPEATHGLLMAIQSSPARAVSEVVKRYQQA